MISKSPNKQTKYCSLGGSILGDLPGDGGGGSRRLNKTRDPIRSASKDEGGRRCKVDSNHFDSETEHDNRRSQVDSYHGSGARHDGRRDEAQRVPTVPRNLRARHFDLKRAPHVPQDLETSDGSETGSDNRSNLSRTGNLKITVQGSKGEHGKGRGSEWEEVRTESENTASLLEDTILVNCASMGPRYRKRPGVIDRSHQVAFAHSSQGEANKRSENHLPFSRTKERKNDKDEGDDAGAMQVDVASQWIRACSWVVLISVVISIFSVLRREPGPTRRQRIRHSLGIKAGRAKIGGERLCSGIEPAATPWPPDLESQNMGSRVFRERNQDEWVSESKDRSVWLDVWLNLWLTTMYASLCGSI